MQTLPEGWYHHPDTQISITNCVFKREVEPIYPCKHEVYLADNRYLVHALRDAFDNVVGAMAIEVDSPPEVQIVFMKNLVSWAQTYHKKDCISKFKAWNELLNNARGTKKNAPETNQGAIPKKNRLRKTALH